MELLRLSAIAKKRSWPSRRSNLLPKQIAKPPEPSAIFLGRGGAAEDHIRIHARGRAGELERQVAQLARKMARRLVESEHGTRPQAQLARTVEDLAKLLGHPSSSRRAPSARRVGIANGLAWTQAGGEVLHVEAQMMPGKAT